MHELHAEYDPFLVAASYAISVLGSYVALQFAVRIPSATGKVALSWLIGAGVALGGGAIWAMHFLAMLAYQLPVAVSYDGPLTLISLVAAIVVSSIGLWIVSNKTVDFVRLIRGGLFTGLGVAAMHYIGMAAMQMRAEILYNPTLVILSLVIAVVASFVALWLAFHLHKHWQRIGAAFVMAVAVFGMHYTGMAAATLVPTDALVQTSSWVLQGQDLGFYVFVLSFVVLSLLTLQLLISSGHEHALTQGLSIKKKASICIAFFLFSMLSFSFVSYRNVHKFQTILEERQANLFVLHSAAQADTIQQTIRATVLSLLISPVPAENGTLQKTQQQIAEYTATLQTALTRIGRQTTSQQRQTVVAELRPLSANYETTIKEIVTLIAMGQQTLPQPLLQRLQEQTQQLSSQLAQLTMSVQAEVAATIKLGDQTVTAMKHTFVWLLILGPTITILVTVLVVRFITHPLKEMTTAAKRIAMGDIDQLPKYQAADESGDLAAAFRDLIVYLKRITEAAESISKGDLSVQVTPVSDRDLLSRSFLRMVSNLRTLNSQVQQSASILTDSIEQIVDSVAQLTTSTQETAATVTQTAATVEQVKQTVWVSGNKAQEIAESAQVTAQSSHGGVKAAEEARSGLVRAQTQIAMIAESVVQLGEQTQAIGNIIDTVNEVAEQSNLLAVNAAIEAAKAGNHGKGFAVVAHEVRSLAERSKQATAQIRVILSDIHEAAHTAVLVTEQGTRAIEGGIEQSLTAGESIQSLARNITEAAQVVTQIAASSQQQLIGMDQAASAMVSVKQASLQNAEGMKKIEHATRNLQRVGHTLKSLTEQYKLSNSNPNRV